MATENAVFAALQLERCGLSSLSEIPPEMTEAEKEADVEQKSKLSFAPD